MKQGLITFIMGLFFVTSSAALYGIEKDRAYPEENGNFIHLPLVFHSNSSSSLLADKSDFTLHNYLHTPYCADANQKLKCKREVFGKVPSLDVDAVSAEWEVLAKNLVRAPKAQVYMITILRTVKWLNDITKS